VRTAVSLIIVVIALGACSVSVLDALLVPQRARSFRAYVSPPPEPFALRRRELHVGVRWGREAAWLRSAVEMFSSRADVLALPYGTPVSVWTLGDDVVAAEVFRDDDAGGSLFAAPALDGASRMVRFYDEQARAIDGAFLARPVAYDYVSSRFGPRVHPITGKNQRHRGVDLSARRGTPVLSAGDGVVVTAMEHATAGLHVVVRHQNGVRTKYFHLDALADGIAPGKRVKRAQPLGVVGSTGMSTGPHLHFEVMQHGASADPLAFAWPAGARLPKKQREAHLAVVDKLRAMTSEDVLFTWSDTPARMIATTPAPAAPST
jgi:murein DD-endopeptidase MepM/ murein hydrolase activator NlpD